MEIWIAYLSLGACAGLLAGLLGVGGGLIMVPALAMLFAQQNIDSASIMHLALGTSLASIVFTSLSSIRAHHRHHAIHWQAVRQLTPGLVLGTLLGSMLAAELSTAILKPVFGIFALAVAIYMLSAVKPQVHVNAARGWPFNASGGVIGAISALVGIGGGTLSVPLLMWYSVPLRHAIASSAACGLPIALAGAASYIAHGWQQSALPEHTLGYVHLPALAGIVMSSMLFAPLGAHWAHRLPVSRLKKIFGGFLLLVALKLLLHDF